LATVLTIIWWLYGYRLWKQSRREGAWTII
jgi:hypothetical protein